MRTGRRLRWRVAIIASRLRGQCSAGLAMWALNNEPVRVTGIRVAVPWRPIENICRRDVAERGRCYCGKLAADGSVLRAGEKVPESGGMHDGGY